MLDARRRGARTGIIGLLATGLVMWFPLAFGQQRVQFTPVAPCALVAWPSQQSRCAGGAATFAAPESRGAGMVFADRRTTPAARPQRALAQVLDPPARAIRRGRDDRRRCLLGDLEFDSRR